MSLFPGLGPSPASRRDRGPAAGPSLPEPSDDLVATADRRARDLVWSLQMGGWTQQQAGNLVALLHGLRPVDAGWSVREIDHLRFLRSLVASGRVGS